MRSPLGKFARRMRSRSKNRFGFESLESRLMLSGTPPTVVDVNVSSTSWSSAFVSYLESNSLGTNGYSIPVGSSAQLDPLPWNNIDLIRITFSEDVNVDAADLSISGIAPTAYTFEDFLYDPQTHVATWTLPTAFNRNRILLDLDANGIDPIEDLDGNVLDGDWTNESSTYNSGDGTAGGDFEFLFNVLPGDVDGYGGVQLQDHTSVLNDVDNNTNSSNYDPKYDVDGDGNIEYQDADFVFGRIGDTQYSGDPAGLFNDAPTTSGLEHVDIDDDAVDVAISLFSVFDDAESSSNGLTYTVVNNSDSSLFDSVSIDQAEGELILNTAAGASGRAEITIRATDAGGLVVETTQWVDVDYVNQAPVITISAEYVGGYSWVITGTVTDADDDVEGWLVEFTGIATARAYVDSDGNYKAAVILDPGQIGWLYCMTTDPHEEDSNNPGVYIGLQLPKK